MNSAADPDTTRAEMRAHYERHPSRASRRLSVLVTVTVSTGRTARGAPDTRVAEVLVIDASGSMLYPRTKIKEAKDAACAAIDALPDGAWFAVLQGDNTIRMVYPREPTLVPLSDRIRRDAREAVRTLHPGGGGTFIGRWLDGARELLEPHGDRRRHTTLLTDGRNTQPRKDLDRAIEACRPVLNCDARGIGGDWSPDELLRIVEALHGSAPALSAIGDLTEDFVEVMRRLTHRVVPELSLRVRCGRGVRLSHAEQAHPALMDMAQHGAADGTRVTGFSLGPWGDETREYMLTFEADPDAAPEGAQHRIARIDLLSEPSGAPVPGGPVHIDVRWIDAEPVQSHLMTQHEQRRELVTLLGSGCRAWLAGDRPEALRAWLRARDLARRLGDEESLGRLDLLLAGDALRPGVTEQLVKQVEFASTLTTAFTPGAEAAEASGRASPVCPKCGRIAPAEARFCENGDHEFPEAPAEGPAR